MAIALVDVNNFYARCERLFRPELRGRPLVVLSNNDGCVVSRSYEAKAMGIKMGVPYFQIREPFEAHGGVAFSSNYALYGDMSSRVMSTLETMAPELEVYSIDEAFLALSASFAGDLTAYGQQIRQRVLQWTGLTVGVGIGPTKTLAKLANYAAKKWPATGGVVDLHDELRRARLMAITPVEEVWGIGRRLTVKLQRQAIHTVADLVASDAKRLRAQFGVVVERIVQGYVACLAQSWPLNRWRSNRSSPAARLASGSPSARQWHKPWRGLWLALPRSCGRRKCAASGCTCLCAPARLMSRPPITSSRPAFGWSAQPMTPVCCCSK